MFGKILIGVDISDEANLVVSKAKILSEKHNSEITLVHVVEPIVIESSYDLVPVLNVDIETSLVERSQRFLKDLSKSQQLNPVKVLTPIGSIKAEIHRAAKEFNADVIILGTHGRHGVALLLGSTANAIIHGAPCDVYCVKIPG